MSPSAGPAAGPGLPDGYAIRPLRAEDAPALAAAYSRNRRHLERWDPARDDFFYTDDGQASALLGQLASIRRGLMAAWVITHRPTLDEPELVVGRVNLNNIIMGVLRSASVGYWVDVEHLGRGLASAAVEFACREARLIGLHRVEAGTQLHNDASQAVLKRCGFSEYGLAEQFLFIAGAWQDHRLFQRILHDQPL